MLMPARSATRCPRNTTPQKRSTCVMSVKRRTLMSNALTIQDAVTPATMLREAIAKGMDAQSIQTLTDVFFRFEEKRAEREFNAALTAFQAECPVILKAKMIEFPTKRGGKFKSQYAEMDDIVEQTKQLREKHGFSFSFKRLMEPKSITVQCDLRHIGGHKTLTEFSVPMPTDFLISEQHAIAGAVTFCERYAFRGSLGITTGLPDNDGKEFIGKIPKEQVEQLQALIEETDSDIEPFWSFARVEKLEDIAAADFARIFQMLLQKKRLKDENAKRKV